MFVPAQIQARVTQIIREGLDKANKKYNLNMPMPRIVYEKRGSTAGTANYRTWTIDLNAELLMKHTEEFLGDTPLHELGHLVCDKVYPEAHSTFGKQGQWTSRGYRRAKRDVHGARWQECTRACGHPDPTRCHNMDTTGIKQVKSGGGDWMCTCGCNKKTHVGPKIHAQLLKNPSSRWFHRGYPLKQVGAAAPLPVIVRTGMPAFIPEVTVVRAADQTGSKLDQCWAIYKRNVGGSRQAIIQTMISVANCTPAGAATYYATCKKRYESGVL